jgi:hypothetical protein
MPATPSATDDAREAIARSTAPTTRPSTDGVDSAGSTTPVSTTAPRSTADPSSVVRNQAPPKTSGELVSRFMDELSTTIQRRPDRLPSTYRPMADAITGGRRVMLSSDSNSRRALRSVGKVAATTNDVIHLDTATTPRHRLDEVIAHELTHVAHPSATPRFFDDIDHSPEERKAEQMAELIARSPLAPNSPAATRPPKPSTDDTIRRTPATRSGPSSGGTIGAASLASRISGTSSPSSTSSSASSISRSSAPHSSELLRRAIDQGATRTGSSSSPSNSGEQIQRKVSSSQMGQFTESDTGSSNGGAPIGNLADVPGAEAWFVEQLTRHFDQIINQLEQRMIVEFERRGGRTWGGI